MVHKKRLLRLRRSVSKLRTSVKGFGKKLNTPQNVKILKIALLALGITVVAWHYQPSRKILAAAGINLKSTVIRLKSILIPTRDQTSELTKVEKPSNFNKRVPKWLEKAGTGLIIVIIGVVVCHSQGVTPFNSPDTTSRDIESESIITDIVSVIKNTVNDHETLAAILTYLGAASFWVGRQVQRVTFITVSNGMLVTAWQLLTTVAAWKNRT